MGSFDILNSIREDLAKVANDAEDIVHKPKYCFLELRDWIERILGYLEDRHSIPSLPPNTELAALQQGPNEYRINRLQQYLKNAISDLQIRLLHDIRTSGNWGAHPEGKEHLLTTANAERALHQARQIRDWLYQLHGLSPNSNTSSPGSGTPEYKPPSATCPPKPQPTTPNGFQYVLLVILLFIPTYLLFAHFLSPPPVLKLSAAVEMVKDTYQKKLDPSNPDHVQLGTTAVVDDYALQLWVAENTGGQALLKYDSTSGQWVVVSAGGGAWDVEGLVAFGVPQDIATELLAQISQSHSGAQTRNDQLQTNKLPVRDGRYAWVKIPCDTAPMAYRDVIAHGEPLHSPQYGVCTTHVASRTANVYTVSSDCTGGSPGDPPIVTYKIVNSTEYVFESKFAHRLMRWCSGL